MLELLFRSKAEVAVLSVVLFYENLHLREIARRADISAPETKRELDILQKTGLLKVRKQGNMSIYSLNKKCLFLEELRGLFTKTEGIVDILKNRLEDIENLRFCLVYGSYANNRFGENSDLDVLCIGENKGLDEIFFDIQRKTGLEINYIIWNENDYKQKIEEKSAFVKSILKNRKIFIVGDENEFGRTSKKKGDRGN